MSDRNPATGGKIFGSLRIGLKKDICPGCVRNFLTAGQSRAILHYFRTNVFLPPILQN